MNYHNEMINLQEPKRRELIACSGQGELAYKYGFRDARHAAAELAIQADNRIEELESALQEILAVHANDNIRPKAFYIADKALDTSKNP